MKMRTVLVMMPRVMSYLKSLSNRVTLGHNPLPPLVPRAAGDGDDDDHYESCILTRPEMITIMITKTITMTIPGVRHERGPGDDALEPLLEAGPVLVLLVRQRVDDDLVVEIIQGGGKLPRALEGGDAGGHLGSGREQIQIQT